MRFTFLVVGALIVGTGIAIVIGLLVNPASGPSGDIQATTVEYKIQMPTTLSTGKHTIGLTNDGKIGHEIVIFKTDLRADELPLGKDGDVNEDASELHAVADSGDALGPGKTKSFPTDDLTPGHYVAVCNLPGHYKAGMYLDVTVR